MMRVYFFCVEAGRPDCAHYQHETVVLAEGLKQLGVELYSNINYWQETPGGDWLLPQSDKVHPKDCDIVIISNHWLDAQRPLPAVLFERQRAFRSVFIDASDGVRTYGFRTEMRSFDLVLKCHYSRTWNYPKNMKPWVFGLSNRMIAACAAGSKSGRENGILCNYRNTHGVRDYVIDHVLPKLEALLPAITSVDGFDTIPEDPQAKHWWEQSGRRHYPSYYKRLATLKACAAFGGYFLEPYFRNKNGLMHRIAGRLIGPFLDHSYCISQWDSWRLWESLASGCVAFHLDFEAYGIMMPVQPENGVHYLGLDLLDFEQVLTLLEKQPENLSRIAEQGRAFALEHYSPLPSAKRLLDYLGMKV